MNRFIRLDTLWSTSEWLAVLSAEAKLAWIELLCYTKAHGRFGRVRSLSAIVAARMWLIGDEAVRQMLMAAERHGAVKVDDGEWVITKWREFQEDESNAERQKEYRRKKKEREKTLQHETATNDNEPLRNGSNARGEDRRGDDKSPPKSPSGTSEPATRKRLTPAEVEELAR